MNKTHFVLGGDLKKSLTEGYTLDIKQLFKDAFTITRKNYLSLISACLVTVSIVIILYTLGFDALSELSESKQVIINFVVSSFIITPLTTGLQMMGIHHSIGLKSRATDLFNCFNMIFKLALANMTINVALYLSSVLLSEFLGEVGINLSYVVMIYVNMVFCMVCPLIAEKKFSAQLAIKLSFKLINKNLRQFTLLFLLLGLLGLIAILPSGLGLFLFVPFYFNLIGIVYRQMCGVGVVATDISDDDDNTPGNGANQDHTSKNNRPKNPSEFEA